MSQLWEDQMAFLNDVSIDTFAQPTIYLRSGYPAFSMQGVPEFLSRLEDVNRGQFISMTYRTKDFVNSPFRASLTGTFSTTPSSGTSITIDGITYTCYMQSNLNDTVAYQFWRGTTPILAAQSLALAINGGSPQTGYYSAATPAHPTCFATWQTGSASVQILYRTPGTIGNGTPITNQLTGAFTLNATVLVGGGPLVGDLTTFQGLQYVISDVPTADEEQMIQVRLQKQTAA